MIPSQNQPSRAVIALWHRANSGKTQTLRALSNVFVNAFPGVRPIVDERVAEDPHLDFTFVISVEGRNVAIVSCGDPGRLLQRRLRSINDEYSPALIFCACRTKGETVHAVDHFDSDLEQGQRFQRFWTSTYEGDQDFWEHLNALKAQHLFELAQSLGFVPNA